jgi:signal transduction histidine kinase
VDASLLVLVKGLVAAVLLPALTAGALSGRHLDGPPTGLGARAGLVAVFALMSCLGATLTSGLASSVRPLPMLQIVQTARVMPPEVLHRDVRPRLAEIVLVTARASGRPVSQDQAAAEADRLVGLLVHVRSLPADQFETKAHAIVHEMVFGGDLPGLLIGMVWAPEIDGSLSVSIAAGLSGGLPVGAAAGAIGMAFRAWSGQGAGAFLLPTLAAGLAGGLLAGAFRRGAIGARASFGAGVSAGAAQLVWVLALSPPGYAGPAVLLTGATLALLHGTGLALFTSLRRLDRLEARRRELEAAEVKARLDLLTAQVKPHFLFNALNTIAATSASDPELTRHLIRSLADFLRLSLKPSPPTIPLADELVNLQPYLELERARFGERLAIQVELSPEARTAQVPPLLLQPLVENAVAHGFRPGGETLTVRIHATVADGHVAVTVSDDGAGAPAGRLAALARGEGLCIGLSSVRERVRHLDPPGEVVAGPAESSRTPGASGGFAVRVRIPGGRPVGR